MKILRTFSCCLHCVLAWFYRLQPTQPNSASPCCRSRQCSWLHWALYPTWLHHLGPSWKPHYHAYDNTPVSST